MGLDFAQIRCKDNHGLFVRPSALSSMSDVEEAAIKIQKTFRGHRARTYSAEVRADKVILPLVCVSDPHASWSVHAHSLPVLFLPPSWPSSKSPKVKVPQ
jgi:hypothetical protein